MNPRQEFLVIESGDDVGVYTPSTFPLGTPIGPDARRLVVDGPSRVRPPKVHLTEAEFAAWQNQLEGAGYEVTLGPFWRDPASREEIEAAIRGETKTWTLQEAREVLLCEAALREAGGRSGDGDRRLEPVRDPARSM
jgi:hypothetical protein